MKKSTNHIVVLPKRGTLEDWEERNPIINEKELCCVLMPSGECRWKIGDGNTYFKDLDYISNFSDIGYFHLCDDRMNVITTVYLNPFEYSSDNFK